MRLIDMHCDTIWMLMRDENVGLQKNQFCVDIEKMKMLLPLTMNINNAYMKKLLYTNITILNTQTIKFRFAYFNKTH